MADHSGIMAIEDELQERRNDYDVTNTVRVSSPAEVRAAVNDLFDALYPQSRRSTRSGSRFTTSSGVHAARSRIITRVDTTYHDIQHTLDMTLALARLIAGHEMSVERRDRLGADRAELAIVSALFHDSGYLRHKERDADAVNGAVFTRVHVTRSGSFSRSICRRSGSTDSRPWCRGSCTSRATS